MPQVTYRYTRGNLIENPQNYFFSEFEGPEFLDAWRASRRSILAQTGILSYGQIPPVLSRDFDLSDFVSSSGRIETKRLLEALCNILAGEDRSLDGKIKPVVDLLVKKFEVTKRVCDEYERNLKNLSGADYGDVQLYLVLAEVFEKAYARWRRLPLLNALLKINDTLISVSVSFNASQKEKLSYLITREEIHVREWLRPEGAV